MNCPDQSHTSDTPLIDPRTLLILALAGAVGVLVGLVPSSVMTTSVLRTAGVPGSDGGASASAVGGSAIGTAGSLVA